MRGATVGTASEVRLPRGEWITEIEGTFSELAISKLSFVTSKGIALSSKSGLAMLMPSVQGPYGDHMAMCRLPLRFIGTNFGLIWDCCTFPANGASPSHGW